MIEVSVRSRVVRAGVHAVRAAARLASEIGGGTEGELSIALVGDRTMKRLHAEYLGIDETTDVLAFPLGEGAGEVVVSLAVAAREAAARGLDPREEALRYVAHGVLHLCGLDDENPAERRAMRRAEEKVLRRLRKDALL